MQIAINIQITDPVGNEIATNLCSWFRSDDIQQGIDTSKNHYYSHKWHSLDKHKSRYIHCNLYK